jgi:uncharacterized protein (DUF1800 family)
MLTPFDKASHLWRRAGFGATTQQIHETVERGIEATLDDVLDLEKEDADMEEELSKLSGDVFDLNNNGEDVRCWWLYRMIHSRRPLREKLTLFWHGHFATSLAKVERPAHMLDQNRTLRRLADAPFRQILDAISRDPAMLVYLDGNSNRKGKPNENYARELFELFSLGIGNYTEKDIQESARAFTGWGVADGTFRFDPKQHDPGPKTSIGRSGNLDGRDILDAIAEHPATPNFLARKLCRFFVNNEPSQAYVDRVAEAYRRSGGHVRAMVIAIFRDPEFFSEENARAIVKSPAEYVVSCLRVLDVRIPVRNLLQPMRRMGQILLAPPSVKGWDGGAAWLTSASLFERANYALTVSSMRGMHDEPRFDPVAWARGRHFDTPGEFVDALALEILHGPPTPQTREAIVEYLLPEKKADAKKEADMKGGMTEAAKAPPTPNFAFDPKALDVKIRGALRLLLCSPEFQLA